MPEFDQRQVYGQEHGAARGPRSPLSFRVARDRKTIIRSVLDSNGQEHLSELPLAVPFSIALNDPFGSFDLSWLRNPHQPWDHTPQPSIRTVSVFSGCGGMALGVCDAAWALGAKHEIVLAVDTNQDALAVFKDNFRPGVAKPDPVETLFDGDLGQPLTMSEKHLRRKVGKVDFVIGGPPCQGNSNLNNHTRRADPKNALYAKMARCAEVLKPAHVVIENVRGVIYDEGRVVARTVKWLRRLGYRVSTGLLAASSVGVPQLRTRHFLVASRSVEFDFLSVSAMYACPARPVCWAIGDIQRVRGSKNVFDTSATVSPQNVKRIRYLFKHDLYNLPDSQRPDCHRLKPHKYKSVYGRLHWNQPAQTITAGFGSPGQGRFVHPLMHRTLTPHEAARLQFFPDFFRFTDDLSRTAVQQLIGNAVPSKLAFVITLELLRHCQPPVLCDKQRTPLLPHNGKRRRAVQRNGKLS